MASNKSAVRYAKALLELAIEKNCVEAVENDLSRFLKSIKESNDLRVFIDSPVVRNEKKIKVFDLVFTDFNPMTIQFFRLVTKNGREHLLDDIAKRFNQLLKAKRGIVTGTLTSAKPLDEQTKAAILDKIKGSFEGTLELEEAVNESLIGGFVVRIGDKQMDASVQASLSKLRQNLVK
ncbi:MAG: ATP synthase F1 subunit delta [Flavobacteriales bacterium]